MDVPAHVRPKRQSRPKETTSTLIQFQPSSRSHDVSYCATSGYEYRMGDFDARQSRMSPLTPRLTTYTERCIYTDGSRVATWPGGISSAAQQIGRFSPASRLIKERRARVCGSPRQH